MNEMWIALEDRYGLRIDHIFCIAIVMIIADIFSSVIGWTMNMWDINPLYSFPDIIVNTFVIMITHGLLVLSMIYIDMKINLKWFSYILYFTVAGVYSFILYWNILVILLEVSHGS